MDDPVTMTLVEHRRQVFVIVVYAATIRDGTRESISLRHLLLSCGQRYQLAPLFQFRVRVGALHCGRLDINI